MVLHQIATGTSCLYVINYTSNHYLLIDTGASYTIIDQKFATEVLKLIPAGIPQPLFTPGGNQLMVRSINFQFMGITKKCFTGDFENFLRKFSTTTVGIIGTDFLHHLKAVIDIGKLTIEFAAIVSDRE